MNDINEQPLFSDQNATISTSMAVVNGVTYPIHNISSVRINTKKPGLVSGSSLAGLLGVLAAIYATREPVLLVVVAICVGVIIYHRMHPTYVLVVVSAGEEGSWIESASLDYVETIRSAIESAIQAQGNPYAAAATARAVESAPNVTRLVLKSSKH